MNRYTEARSDTPSLSSALRSPHHCIKRPVMLFDCHFQIEANTLPDTRASNCCHCREELLLIFEKLYHNTTIRPSIPPVLWWLVMSQGMVLILKSSNHLDLILDFTGYR